MNWIKCEIETDDLNAVMDELAAISVYEYEIVENFDKVKKQLDEMKDQWDFIDEQKLSNETEKVIVYLADEPQSHERFSEIKNVLEKIPARSQVKLKPFKDSDWIEKWKEFFSRIKVGDNINIVPVWDKEELPEGIVLKMDPGMIFGTGDHETTQLCMKEIEEVIKKGDKVLDLGTGSGILSILSILLGADSALGVDIDPGAKQIVAQNCKDNEIQSIEILIGDLLNDQKLIEKIQSEQYDLVVANIVADVIIQILPLVKACLKPQHIFICSGIIDDRIEDVRIALEQQGFEILKNQREGEWAVFTTRFING